MLSPKDGIETEKSETDLIELNLIEEIEKYTIKTKGKIENTLKPGLNSLFLEKVLEDDDFYEILPFLQEIKPNNIKLDGKKYEVLFRIENKKTKELIYPDVLEGIQSSISNQILLKLLIKVSSCIKKEDIISFNLTKDNLNSSEVIYGFLDIIQKFNLKPENFIIEILEETIEDKKTFENLRILKKWGFKLALDDFGVDFTDISKILEYEKEGINLDYIKIDRLFFHKIKKHNIFPKLINYLKNNNKKIIVEGVEKEEDQKLVESLGIEYTQGYYFGKPQSYKEILDIK